MYTDSQHNYYLQYLYADRPDGTFRYGYEACVRDHKTGNTAKLKNILNINQFRRIGESPYYTDDAHVFAIADYATDCYVNALSIAIKRYNVMGNYVKDNVAVYYGAREIEGANAPTFSTLILKTAGMDIELGYDDKRLYYTHYVLSDKDLNELTIDPAIKDQLKKSFLHRSNEQIRLNLK